MIMFCPELRAYLKKETTEEVDVQKADRRLREERKAAAEAKAEAKAQTKKT